jgi:hypothetical protein
MDEDKRHLKGRPDEFNTFDKVQQYLLLVSERDWRGGSKHPWQISSLGDGGKKGKKSKVNGKFKGKVEARNYTAKEWRSMDDAQKEKIRELRAKKKKSKGKRKFHCLKITIQRKQTNIHHVRYWDKNSLRVNFSSSIMPEDFNQLMQQSQ